MSRKQVVMVTNLPSKLSQAMKAKCGGVVHSIHPGITIFGKASMSRGSQLDKLASGVALEARKKYVSAIRVSGDRLKLELHQPVGSGDKVVSSETKDTLGQINDQAQGPCHASR
jgi:hypothetical protein